MITEKIMFFCPIPSFPRGEGIEDFSPTGRKKEGLIILIMLVCGINAMAQENAASLPELQELDT